MHEISGLLIDNAKDDEGFYFKGNTTLPISTWQAPDNDEENWDDEGNPSFY